MRNKGWKEITVGKPKTVIRADS